MAWIGAAIGGAQSGIGAVTSAYTSHQQAEAARRAAQFALQSGQQGAGIVEQGNLAAQQYAQQGQAGALGQYDAAQRYAETQRAQLAGMYSPARQVGSDAMVRYQAALVGGDNSGVYRDPAFAMRMGAASGSAARLAQSAGLGADTSVAAGVAGYNRRLADAEYRNALARLQGLSAMGSQASLNHANADAAAFAGLQNISGARAGQLENAGRYNAMLTQNAAIAAANSRLGLASQVAQYDTQAQSSRLQGYANASNYLQQGGANAAYLAGRGG